MAQAGTRERQFIDFCNQIDNKLLSGKISFTDKEYAEVSVDNSIILGNAVILIEIDSSNQAKLVAGQYTLLNILRSKPLTKYEDIVKGKELVFFVVHCFGNDARGNRYNPERSRRNFSLINREAFSNAGLKYGSIHIDDIINDNINTREKLLSVIRKNIVE